MVADISCIPKLYEISLSTERQQLLRWDLSAIFLIFNALSYFHSFCRREMMPLLSLIFSALFILFGTVVIQAFR